MLRALQVSDYSTSYTHNVCRRSAEVVIPCSRCCPHLVVLQQVRINEHTQLSAVTKGRHATIGFGNSKTLGHATQEGDGAKCGAKFADTSCVIYEEVAGVRTLTARKFFLEKTTLTRPDYSLVSSKKSTP